MRLCNRTPARYVDGIGLRRQYAVMAYIVMACIGMACIVTAYIVMACIVTAYIVMACIVMGTSMG